MSWGDTLGVFLAKRVIKTNHTIFTIAVFTSNNKIMFTFAIVLACLAVPVVLFVKSRHVNEPYENNAEHRKNQGKMEKYQALELYSSGVCSIFICNTYRA